LTPPFVYEFTKLVNNDIAFLHGIDTVLFKPYPVICVLYSADVTRRNTYDIFSRANIIGIPHVDVKYDIYIASRSL
jgi:hypothetical protein